MEGLHILQRLQVAELSDVVVREYEGSEVGDREVERGRDGGYSVVREQDCAEAAEEGNVPEHGDGVVGEVYAVILVLTRPSHQRDASKVVREQAERTLVIPRFSIAGMV